MSLSSTLLRKISLFLPSFHSYLSSIASLLVRTLLIAKNLQKDAWFATMFLLCCVVVLR